MFPAVDVLRLAVRHTAVCEYYCRPGDGKAFISLLLSWLQEKSTPGPVQLLTLRTLSNMFQQLSGISLIQNHITDVLKTVGQIALQNKHIQVAAATVALNLAVLLSSTQDKEAKAELIGLLRSLSEQTTETEAQFRLLVAIGTVVTGDASAKETG